MADTRRAATQPRLTLDTPVTYLKGVGPARALALAKLGVIFARDLLYHVPHRYEDASTVSRIADLEAGMDGTVVGRVVSKGVIPTRKGLRIFQAVVKDATGMLEVSWPGQPFLDRTIAKGDVLLLTGTVRFFHGRQLHPREFVNLGAEEEGTGGGRVLSVYPATEGLSFKQIRALVESHLDALLPQVRELLPPDLLALAGVPPLPEALRMVHRPTSIAEALEGRSRLAFEELLCVHILHRRANALARDDRHGIAFVNRRELTSALKGALPFELTGAQTRALRDIVADMTGGRRMHRLLQGDVGSGKTVVALFASLLAMENGWQAAVMAPTELLAEQHHRTFSRLLEPLGIRPVLITGRLGARERREAAEVIGRPAPALAVGTHALVQAATGFARLGFVAIDEQHRFGVEQRKALGAKGEAPDVLLMSATPIPRSLALTLYGDLDVSILDEKPPGRRPITSALRPESARERVLQFLDREIEKGRQAYVVYPLIDESEKTDLKAATVAFEELAAGPLAHRRLGLLHGRLPAEQKDAVMRAFRDGELDVLVATTVIEVGIDVANATMMLIEHPERFGLSQLHQLRGRVGRGGEQSYCVLLGDVGQEAAERLQIFVDTEDGFEIARADLRLRGMGDLFGERQSGEPTFRIADPLRDEELNLAAREGAERLLDRDPELMKPESQGIRQVLGTRYARSIELFRVG
ncbi:ATP-dependent DNA helicase RecG [Roseisolibacter sp. H3M3-2]|uniref:ATP-dependent DNA helicase RecG n=1 Tax=Roseisolibacter sp. H3M3-2 TaxID=3031323 RepID=UPI0023D9EC12|nr:ATP-dependent DNA helicase RecG [Roseisolibacter sp. H3M3-2]MDF1505348.1 ATP-dependent DNA helicase RecG [Roseisolibacter sp. H3M3-2]